jgi:hypothetical protein
MTIRKLQANEGQDYTLTIVSEVDTSAGTVTARIREVNGSGTGTTVSTANGANAGVRIPLSLDISSFSSGNYDLEVYYNYAESDRQILAPNASYTLRLEIVERFSIAPITSGIGFLIIGTDFIIG